MNKAEFFVHATACIDQPVEIGSGTKIWHFCHVMPGAEIGRDCILGQNSFIGAGVRIGHRVKIQNNVSLYSGVVVEDEVFIGPSAVFTNVINPRSFIERKTDFRETRLHKGCTIGANATIICGVSIGEYALVGAGAVVTKDVVPFELVTGVPALPAGWVSKHGHRLQFNTDYIAVCPETGEKYHLDENGVRVLDK